MRYLLVGAITPKRKRERERGGGIKSRRGRKKEGKNRERKIKERLGRKKENVMVKKGREGDG